MKIKVYYDGVCSACTSSILKYSRLHAGIKPIDLNKVNLKKEGLDEKAHKLLHIKIGKNTLKGIDALIYLWERTPGYRWLALLSKIFKPFAKLAYHLFATFRHKI
tara:strand:+ start:197 stop:511 length:315 start_codon:yes stop_codon:yes gene_type:complete